MRTEKEKLINDIEQLYLPDRHESGKDILIEALCKSWRELPIEILRVLKALNVQKEWEQWK